MPYTIRHIYRMEKAGKFPSRVKVGANRVAWVRSEVQRWLELRVANRIEITAAALEPVF